MSKEEIKALDDYLDTIQQLVSDVNDAAQQLQTVVTEARATRKTAEEKLNGTR